MTETLTLQELAERIGEPAEHLREWRSLGLIGRKSDDPFGAEDVQRARFIQFLLRRGVALAAVTGADKEHGFLSRYIEMMFPGGPEPTALLGNPSQLVGLEPEALRRVWEALGLGEQGELLCEADIQVLKAIKQILDAGFPEEALLQLVRVYADALGRVAEAEVRLFHFYVHERLSARGASEQNLWEISEAARERMVPLIKPLLLYFHNKGFERAVMEDAVMHLQEEATQSDKVGVPGQLRAAIVFIDLVQLHPVD